MDYFFDSSAIVKRYRQERGSPWVRAICKRSSRSTIHLAALAQVEGVTALYRLARLYNLHVSWADATSNELLRHMRNEYRVIPLSVPVLDAATALSRQYWMPSPLRSLDAIQLACALVLRVRVPSLTFVTADGQMEEIARQEHFSVINPLHT